VARFYTPFGAFSTEGPPGPAEGSGSNCVIRTPAAGIGPGARDAPGAPGRSRASPPGEHVLALLELLGHLHQPASRGLLGQLVGPRGPESAGPGGAHRRCALRPLRPLGASQKRRRRAGSRRFRTASLSRSRPASWASRSRCRRWPSTPPARSSRSAPRDGSGRRFRSSTSHSRARRPRAQRGSRRTGSGSGGDRRGGSRTRSDRERSGWRRPPGRPEASMGPQGGRSPEWIPQRIMII